MQHVAERYCVREAILFGSRAPHHHPDSDTDIAVVLDGAHGNRTAAALDMAGIAFKVVMEMGVMVEALPLWTDDLERPDAYRRRHVPHRFEVGGQQEQSPPSI